MTAWHDSMTKNHKQSLLSIDMKTKVVQHVPVINISTWHMTAWHDSMTNNHKQWLLSVDMKTKVVQHVPVINIWVKSCRTGKKCFKWPNLTLTPRDVLAKPFILQTWVFYPVGLLSPGHLHKDWQLPGTIFKGWKVSLEFWHLGVLG